MLVDFTTKVKGVEYNGRHGVSTLLGDLKGKPSGSHEAGRRTSNT
jgi:hypothetical protein